MGNAGTKKNYDVQGTYFKNPTPKDTKKSSGNASKKTGSSKSGTSSSSKPHPKGKVLNQNVIAEEVEESDQTSDTKTTLKEDMQTPPEKSVSGDVKEGEQLPTPANNQAPETTEQSGTEMKKTNEEDEGSVNAEVSSPSMSNQSSETPSHHATGEKIEAPTPTPHISATKVDVESSPETSSPDTSDLKLPEEDTKSDTKAEDSASANIEAKLVEEGTEKVEESKDCECKEKNTPNENKTDEVRIENEAEKERVKEEAEEISTEKETEQLPAKNETEKAPAKEEAEKLREENETETLPIDNETKQIETEELAVETKTEAVPLDKTDDNTENKEPEGIQTQESQEKERAEERAEESVSSKEDVTSEEDEKAKDSNVLEDKPKTSPSALSNTAEGDRKTDSSSEADLSAEELFVKGCLKEIQVVRNEAEALKLEVDVFKGTKEDRDYLHLSELLMRKLYKLDSIESKKNEEIRKHKKEAVLFVKDVTQTLEDTVMANSNK